MSWLLSTCQLGDDGTSLIVDALAENTTMNFISRVRLQGADLKNLIEIIPEMNLTNLTVNLDLMDDTVLSSFHKNTSIQGLFKYEISCDETNGSLGHTVL